MSRTEKGNKWHETLHSSVAAANLIPLGTRKAVAAFYTNAEAARLLATFTIDSALNSVLDPACGSGTLLLAAYARKRDLAGSRLTDSDHIRILSDETFGVDVMPFAAHLAATNLLLLRPQTPVGRLHIAIHDSMNLEIGTEAPVTSSTLSP